MLNTLPADLPREKAESPERLGLRSTFPLDPQNSFSEDGYLMSRPGSLCSNGDDSENFICPLLLVIRIYKSISGADVFFSHKAKAIKIN